MFLLLASSSLDDSSYLSTDCFTNIFVCLFGGVLNACKFSMMGGQHCLMMTTAWIALLMEPALWCVVIAIGIEEQ